MYFPNIFVGLKFSWISVLFYENIVFVLPL